MIFCRSVAGIQIYSVGFYVMRCFILFTFRIQDTIKFTNERPVFTVIDAMVKFILASHWSFFGGTNFL